MLPVPMVIPFVVWSSISLLELDLKCSRKVTRLGSTLMNLVNLKAVITITIIIIIIKPLIKFAIRHDNADVLLLRYYATTALTFT